MAEVKKSSNAKDKDKKAKMVKKAEVVAETAPVEAAPKADIEVEKPLAKAGERSTKAQKEADEKEAKKTRKKTIAETDEKSKAASKKAPRDRVERAGKKFREVAKQVDKDKTYSLSEAVELVTKTNPTKFDATVELHVNLGVDPKIAEQNIRATIILPSGSGKTIRVAVLTDEDKVAAAKKAGADLAGTDNLLAMLDKQQIDFDVLIAAPQLMSKLSKYAKLLGPRGLMPNPKSGTVTTETDKAIKETKAGKVEYRSDSAGIIHLGIGKTSLGADKLLENAQVVLTSIRASRPGGLKGAYIKSVYLSSTMGPSIRTEIA